MCVRSINLPTLKHTAVLAEKLAPQIDNHIIFLMGPLGSGKTTFVRHLVSRLPGGENAEIASPSFTLCNIYPTTPEVLHYDLYRLPPGGYDESLEEAIDRIENPSPGQRPLSLLIEWAENMPEILIPESRLEIYWHVQKTENAGRKAVSGDIGEKFFKAVEAEQTARKVVLKGVGAAAELPVFADDYFD